MYNPVGNQCCTCSINKNYNNVPAWGLLTSYYKRCYLRQTHCEKNDCEGCCFLHLKGCCSSASCWLNETSFFSSVLYNASCFSKVCKITVVVLQVTPLCCISPQVYSLIKLHLCVRSLKSLTAKSWQDFSWTSKSHVATGVLYFFSHCGKRWSVSAWVWIPDGTEVGLKGAYSSAGVCCCWRLLLLGSSVLAGDGGIWEEMHTHTHTRTDVTVLSKSPKSHNIFGCSVCHIFRSFRSQ